MKGLRLVGLVILVLGVLALMYGGFTYTQETHDADLGPIEFEIKDKERVNIPAWAGGAAVVVGGLLLAFGGGKPAVRP